MDTVENGHFTAAPLVNREGYNEWVFRSPSTSQDSMQDSAGVHIDLDSFLKSTRRIPTSGTVSCTATGCRARKQGTVARVGCSSEYRTRRDRWWSRSVLKDAVPDHHKCGRRCSNVAPAFKVALKVRAYLVNGPSRASEESSVPTAREPKLLPQAWLGPFSEFCKSH